jgi:hypothetical protein
LGAFVVRPAHKSADATESKSAAFLAFGHLVCGNA